MPFFYYINTFLMFVMVLSTYSGGVFAGGLKDDLLILAKSQNTEEIASILNKITSADFNQELDSIKDMGLTAQELKQISAAVLKVDASKAWKLLDALFKEALKSPATLEILAMFANFLNTVASPPENVRQEIKKVESVVGFLAYRAALALDPITKDFSAIVDQLLTLLKWDDLSEFWRNKIGEAMLESSSYEVIKHILNKQDWVASFIIGLGQSIGDQDVDARRNLFIKASGPFFLNKWDEDKQGMSFKGFYSVLSKPERDEAKEAQETLIKYILMMGDTDENRLILFQNTFGAALRKLENNPKTEEVGEALRSILSANIKFIIEKPELAKPGLEEHSKKLAYLLNIVEGSFREKLQEAIIPYIFASAFEELERTKFAKQVLEPLDASIKVASADPSKVICNQRDYDEGVKINCIRGKALKLDEQTPIGYNVYLPAGEVKAIFTVVYGGHKAQERISSMFMPDETLDSLDKFLLANGVAIVKLNLLDLRELQDYQGDMPEGIHERLHQSINKYFEEFSKNPGLLHPNLDVLRGKPNFLFGASFGGRTAVMQAERFPGTFKGYLSLDGSVYFDVLDKTSKEMLAKKKPWLDPIKKIDQIQDPIVLIHNFDDNNVDVAVSIEFYKKALNTINSLAKPVGPVRLLLNPRGSPMPKDPLKAHNKGHFLPEDPASMSRIGNYILNFINEGPTALPAASELTALTNEILAFGHHIASSDNKNRFLYEAYRHFKASDRQAITDELWQNEYTPMFQAVYFASLFDTLRDTGLLKKELDRLKHKNLLTKDVIANTLKRNEIFFGELLNERYNLKIDEKALNDIMINNSAIHEIFRAWIFSLEDKNTALSTPFAKFLLQELYLANPSLIADFVKENYRNGLGPEAELELKSARDELQNRLEREKEAIERVWKQTIQKVRQRTSV